VSSGCDPISWTCLVDALGDRVAVADADDAVGRLVIGHAAADFHGPDLASNDFVDPDFAGRLDDLDIGGDPLGDIRVGLPEPAATGALRVQLVDLGTRLDQFTQSRGEIPVTVAVVVGGRRADRDAGQPAFTAALEDLGWDVRPDAATTGLPDAGVLVALAQEVR
jgi:hypothetical protein